MTTALTSLGTPPTVAGTSSSATSGASSPEHDRQIRDAARQFEGLLIQQLLQVMRSTGTEGSMFGQGAAGELYGQLFDQHVGESMSAAGGFGLTETFAQAMGASRATAPTLDTSLMGMSFTGHEGTPISPMFGPVLEARPASGAALGGATGALQAAARDMLGPNGVAPQWGREGTLSHEDLQSGIDTEVAGGRARFAVDDARGFQGYYKCNLFALELSRRAGFEVPVIGRARGWGFPGPEALANDAADGSVRGDWARVATGASAEELDSSIVRGDRAFLLTASGADGHRGHMGVVERVHEVRYDDDGRITRIVFDGWEGRSRGAARVERRTWNIVGHGGGTNPRGGLGSIEILALERPADGVEEHALYGARGASVRDAEESTP